MLNLIVFEADPMFVFAFIHTLLDVLQEYLGEVSAGTIRDNFDVVYQVNENTLLKKTCIDKPSAIRRNAGQWISFDNGT